MSDVDQENILNLDTPLWSSKSKLLKIFEDFHFWANSTQIVSSLSLLTGGPSVVYGIQLLDPI